jgi:hypothetical protein
MHFDTDFQEISTEPWTILVFEVTNFTRDFFDNTTWTRTSYSQDGDVPEYARPTACLRDKMDCRLAQHDSPILTSECIESITQMGQSVTSDEIAIAESMFAQTRN